MRTVSTLTVEKLAVPVTASVDPTDNVPEWAFTDGSNPSTWNNGEWSGTWSATNKTITAVSPTVGVSGTATVTLTAGTYTAWVRITNDTTGETPVLEGPTFRVV